MVSYWVNIWTLKKKLTGYSRLNVIAETSSVVYLVGVCLEHEFWLKSHIKVASIYWNQ